MGKHRSFRSKAVHFVADLTTGLLNPISDKPSSKPSPRSSSEDETESKRNTLESVSEEGSRDSGDEPDTTSFSAFLYSLLASEAENKSNQSEQDDFEAETSDTLVDADTMKENSGKKSLFSKGKQHLKALYLAAKYSGSRNQERKDKSDAKLDENVEASFDGLEMKQIANVPKEEEKSLISVPEVSEPSLLMSKHTRTMLYASLPALVQGRRWLLMYSTWRHGISLSTLYRRSMLWPGLSLLVVGDKNGAVFGGLVEAPLKPTSKKYQGTNSTFVFTDKSGPPVIFRPTGANRYFTLCSPDFLAIGGGGHFALYLDSDLLSGSSSVSETYGNPCLATSEEFEVRNVELWGFVYGSKYDEILALSKTESPGICRW